MNELQSVTDIDEVIKYAEREAEGCHQMASAYHTDEGVYLQEETRFQYKAILWENIHEWLEELKELRKKQRPDGEWISKPKRIQVDETDEERIFETCQEWFCSSCGKSFGFRKPEDSFCKYCGSDNRPKEEKICPILSDDEVKQPCIKSPCGFERPQWIPCSERLPEEYNSYLVTKLDTNPNGSTFTTLAYFYTEETGWDIDGVIAWMPFPEPYKKGGENE